MTVYTNNESIKKEMEAVKLKFDSINLQIYPMDYVVLSNSDQEFEHTITNPNTFPVIFQVKATSARFFTISKNAYALYPGESIELLVVRRSHPPKSHRITIECIPSPQNLPSNLSDLFDGIFPVKKFWIRYHKPPTWHEKAVKMNLDQNMEDYPRIMELCYKTGIVKQKDEKILKMNEMNILQMAISKDTEPIKH